jgi:hypothetical protein
MSEKISEKIIRLKKVISDYSETKKQLDPLKRKIIGLGYERTTLFSEIKESYLALVKEYASNHKMLIDVRDTIIIFIESQPNTWYKIDRTKIILSMCQKYASFRHIESFKIDTKKDVIYPQLTIEKLKKEINKEYLVIYTTGYEYRKNGGYIINLNIAFPSISEAVLYKLSN